ncbi:MAG: acyl-CoA thioesterase [Saprospiraceae bacterium]|jgi:acyl-CoA thioesterase
MPTPSEKIATQIIDEMYNKDAFSQWLGIERLYENVGECKLRMTIREEMCNGFGIAHGGITFSFADSAFAFASNSQGRKAVSIETSISHTAACKAGDVITAEAKEESLSNKIGIYMVTVKNQDKKVVALFKGTVYRTGESWL